MTNENENQNTNLTPTIKNKYVITDSMAKGFLNENQNTNLSEITEKKYPVTDSIAAGILVDGLVMAELFAIPYIAPGLLALPVLAPAVITGTAVLYGTSAAYSYYVRANALENEHGILAYVESGINKYGLRQAVKSATNIGYKFYNGKALDVGTEVFTILYESAIGAVNNVAYGLGNKTITGSNSTTLKHLASPYYIESSESAIKAYIENKNIASETNIGLVAGVLVNFHANVVYANAIGPIHTMVDYFYQEPAGQTANQEL